MNPVLLDDTPRRHFLACALVALEAGGLLGDNHLAALGIPAAAPKEKSASRQDLDRMAAAREKKLRRLAAFVNTPAARERRAQQEQLFDASLPIPPPADLAERLEMEKE